MKKNKKSIPGVDELEDKVKNKPENKLENMSKTEPLDEKTDFEGMDSSFFLIGLINRFNNGFQAVADSMFEEISWKQVFFLNCVALFKEPPTIREMAAIVGCSHQNANQILTKLHKIGFVEIQQDSEDKRKQRITLTAKAEAFRNEYSQPSQAAMQGLFQGIDPDELNTTVKVITQLANNLNLL